MWVLYNPRCLDEKRLSLDEETVAASSAALASTGVPDKPASQLALRLLGKPRGSEPVVSASL